MADLEVEQTTTFSRPRLDVRGEVDVYSCTTLRNHLDSLVQAGHQRIDLDLSSVTYIDSAGMSVLVSCQKNLQRTGGALSIVAASRQVRRVLSILSLEDWLSERHAG